MGRFVKLGLIAALALCGASALVPNMAAAQSSSAVVVSACGTPPLTYTAGYPYPITQDTNGFQCVGGAGGTVVVSGNVSNATSGVATTSTNVPTVAYNYGFNGTTWDQTQVDTLKYLRVDSAAAAASVTGSATSNTTLTNFPVVLATAAPGAQSFTAQWTVAGGGNSATYTGSNDGTTFTSLNCQALSGVGLNSPLTNVFTVSTTNPITCSTVGFAQIKIAITSYISGTPTALVQFSQIPAPFSTVAGTVTAVGNTASGSAAAGNPVQTASKVITGVQALSNGNVSSDVATVTGARLVEEGGRTFCNIAGISAATTCKSGAGFIHTVTINTAVGSATVKLFDNTAASGTSIGVITLPSTITSVDPFTLTLDAAFATGLTVATSGATDVTITYR